MDLASYGIVKMLDSRSGEIYPDLPWEPKAAFAALADCYRAAASDTTRTPRYPSAAGVSAVRVAVYIRASTDEAHQPYSLDAQSAGIKPE